MTYTLKDTSANDSGLYWTVVYVRFRLSYSASLSIYFLNLFA